jgi:hypothetical protein
MFQPLASWAQKRYQASLGERLRDYGLRYDDLYDPLMDMVGWGAGVGGGGGGVGWGGGGWGGVAWVEPGLKRGPRRGACERRARAEGPGRRRAAAPPQRASGRSRHGRGARASPLLPPPTHPAQDVAEALRRLPADVVVARNQRLKRAMDLSMKHEKLPKELREKQTPFDHYLLVGGFRLRRRRFDLPGGRGGARAVRGAPREGVALGARAGGQARRAGRAAAGRTGLAWLCARADTPPLTSPPRPPPPPPPRAAADAAAGQGREGGAQPARHGHALPADHPLGAPPGRPPPRPAALGRLRAAGPAPLAGPRPRCVLRPPPGGLSLFQPLLLPGRPPGPPVYDLTAAGGASQHPAAGRASQHPAAIQ